MHTTSSRRAPRAVLTAGALALGLLFAACGGGGDGAIPPGPERSGDATREDFEAAYAYQALTPEDASCRTDALFEELDQDQLNELYDVARDGDYDEGVSTEVAVGEEAASLSCVDPEDLAPEDRDLLPGDES